MKLEYQLVRYLAPAIEPGVDQATSANWRMLVSPRPRRMWPDIPLEVRCAMVERFQTLYGTESTPAL